MNFVHRSQINLIDLEYKVNIACSPHGYIIYSVYLFSFTNLMESP